MKNKNRDVNKEIILDLFQLHNEEDKPKGWIWVTSNTVAYRTEILSYLHNNGRRNVAKNMAVKLNCGVSTAEKHITRFIHNKEANIPLCILRELTNPIPEKKSEIIKSMKQFWTNSDHTKKRISVPHLPSKELAKIIGAHLADGYLQKDCNAYRIKICDGKKDGIEKFSGWLEKVFHCNVRIRFRKEDNTWNGLYSNKIIARFYENLFNIRHGKKSDIAQEPQIIKNAEMAIRNAFVLGVMTFDGGVKSSGTIGFSTKSKKLFNDIREILQNNNMLVNESYNKNKDFWFFESISGRNIYYLKKWQKFFEPGTWKRKRLDLFINHKARGIEEVEELFPKHHRGKICVSDVWLAMHRIHMGGINDIQKELQKKRLFVNKASIYKYLNILEQTKLISTKYKSFARNTTNKQIGIRIAIYKEEDLINKHKSISGEEIICQQLH